MDHKNLFEKINSKTNGNGNDIVNEISNRDSITISISRANRINKVDYIVERLKKSYGDQCECFFYKCAWHLPECIIWDAFEASKSKKVRDPIKYFNAICGRELSRRGF